MNILKTTQALLHLATPDKLATAQHKCRTCGCLSTGLHNHREHLKSSPECERTKDDSNYFKATQLLKAMQLSPHSLVSKEKAAAIAEATGIPLSEIYSLGDNRFKAHNTLFEIVTEDEYTEQAWVYSDIGQFKGRIINAKMGI